TGIDQSTSTLAFHWLSLPFSCSARSSATSLPYSQPFQRTAIGTFTSSFVRIFATCDSSGKSTISKLPSCLRLSCMNLSMAASSVLARDQRALDEIDHVILAPPDLGGGIQRRAEEL